MLLCEVEKKVKIKKNGKCASLLAFLQCGHIVDWHAKSKCCSLFLCLVPLQALQRSDYLPDPYLPTSLHGLSPESLDPYIHLF